MKAAHSSAPPRAQIARRADAERLLHLIQTASAAGRGLRRWLADRLARFELAETEFFVLWLCRQKSAHGGWVQGELAQAAGISPAQTSSLVERLRKRGLIDMKRSTMDRRRQVWHLLQEGEDLLSRIKTGLENVAHRLDAMVSPEEQEAAARLFDRLVDAAERSAALKPFEPDAAADESDVASAEGGRS
ncbi:MAG TPA: MarR family transcriptional regulator [Pirellulaceae bacterium]|jgi:DNA-binding MarR family transcriptional regulator|nr:MarR family transcriptional regulator [Pirellulaceae bacterium]